MGLFTKSPPPPPPPKTTIGEGTSMKGELSTERDVLLEGAFDGTLRSAKTAEVAVRGRCTGTIHCDVLIGGGTLKAEARVDSAARLLSTCAWEGELHAPVLSIERGARVQGRISQAAETR